MNFDINKFDLLMTDAEVMVRGSNLTNDQHSEMQRMLDELQMTLDAAAPGCKKTMTPMEWHLEEAANVCRGRIMTEDEWQHHRALWAGVGMVLAPCRPPQKDVAKKSVLYDNEAFDRAMKAFD